MSHTWPVFRDAVETLFGANPLNFALAEPSMPTTVVVGDADEVTPAGDVRGKGYAVSVVELAGDHLLPLRRVPELCTLIAQQTEALRQEIPS